MHQRELSASNETIAAQRLQIQRIFNAGLKAADPATGLQRCLHLDGALLHILNQNPRHKNHIRVGEWSRIHLVAFGKAACAMVKAVQEIVPNSRLADGVIAVTNYENVQHLQGVEVIGAGHPLPDQNGLRAAKRIAEKVREAMRNELVLVLISGGGSALLPAPHPMLTLTEKIQTTQLLLDSGATINQINCVRKHLSTLKGGGLAGLAAPADMHALILSDVVDNDVSAIASGPTVPDATSFTDAITLLQEKAVWEHVPASVRALLQKGQAGLISETPKPEESLFDTVGYTLTGSNALSIEAAVQQATQEGYECSLYSNHLQGESRDVANTLAEYCQDLLKNKLLNPIALIAGGETTVTLQGTGKGGRNQELALAFAIAAEKLALPATWTLLSGGTDGRDGPTDAAGGVVDSFTLTRMKDVGLVAQTFLDNNDSYSALHASGDLLKTGATGTNVADLLIVLLQPAATR